MIRDSVELSTVEPVAVSPSPRTRLDDLFCGRGGGGRGTACRLDHLVEAEANDPLLEAVGKERSAGAGRAAG